MKGMMMKFGLFIVCLSMYGCASISNEGVVDFRKTDSDRTVTSEELWKYELSDETIMKLKSIEILKEKKAEVDEINDKKYSKVEFIKKIEKIAGIQLTDEQKNRIKLIIDQSSDASRTFQKLSVKNFSLGTGKETRFEKGDLLSLHLRTAYINDFSENPITPYITEMFTRGWGDSIGEIAIVANAFEEIDGKELSFSDTRSGRVVFYSTDIHKGQFLNFNNMPIYGPLSYKGAPFAFRLSIFELDVTSEQSKSMLSTLAEAGSKAYPPASPVLGVLNGLGSTFLDNDQTDIEFRYAMVLDPKGGSNKVNHFILEAGNYVLIRSENRSNNINWDKLVLEENEGRVYKIGEDGRLSEYTDETYLVVEINKNVSYLGVELAENNFSSLMTALEEEDKKKATNWVETRDAIMKVAVDRSQIIHFNRTKEILATLVDSNVVYTQRRSEAMELLTMIADSVNAEGKPFIIDVNDVDSKNKKYYLSSVHIDYVLKRMRELPFVTQDLNTFDLFQAKIIKLEKRHNEILEIISPLSIAGSETVAIVEGDT